MKIQRYVRPKSLDEAYSLVRDEKGFLIGGGAWSRMNARSVELAVDLSSLDLRYIKAGAERIEIGAMSTARDIETSAELQKVFGSLFSDAVAHIVGVQMRNIVTAGGTVGGKYGFSDLLTVLLALDARLALYGEGEVPIEDYLGGNGKSASNKAKLVEKIVVDTSEVKSAFTSMRKTHTDFAVLNAAAAFKNEGWRIAVGARPGVAKLSQEAAKVPGGEGKPDAGTAAKAGSAAAQELSFGGDLRGSSEYRKQICETLVKRSIEEAVK